MSGSLRLWFLRPRLEGACPRRSNKVILDTAGLGLFRKLWSNSFKEAVNMWVVVKIMAPFWVLSIVFRGLKRRP